MDASNVTIRSNNSDASRSSKSLSSRVALNRSRANEPKFQAPSDPNEITKIME